MYCVGLKDRRPVRGLRSAVPVSHRIAFRMPNVPGCLSDHVGTMKSLRMCEKFNFSTLANLIYSSRTTINQPLTVRNRTERRLYIVVIIECGLRLQRMRNKYGKKNKWTDYYYYYYYYWCCDHKVMQIYC